MIYTKEKFERTYTFSVVDKLKILKSIEKIREIVRTELMPPPPRVLANAWNASSGTIVKEYELSLLCSYHLIIIYELDIIEENQPLLLLALIEPLKNTSRLIAPKKLVVYPKPKRDHA